MEQWEYKIIELTTRQRIERVGDGVAEVITFEAVRTEEIKGLFGASKIKQKTVPMAVEELEIKFNALGERGWNLCGTVPLILASSIGPGSNTDRTYFIFKRKKT
ncbi:MAG: hypothetical protein Q8Q46_02965 [Candidatus Giovannonibacteria bacterium]|nr:hypothetical protein [Candidatus Giovannonibacteria bacterium]